MSDPPIFKVTALVDFNDKNLDNVRFVKVNSMPAVGEHQRVKYYFHQAISDSLDEPTLVGKNQDEVFNKFDMTNIKSTTLNSQAVNDTQVITKPYVDQFHQENEQSRRGLGIDCFK